MALSAISSSSSNRITKPVANEFFTDPVYVEIVRAFESLGFNRSHVGVVGAYLAENRPSIDGTVTDETPNRKTRTELTARATSFSTNQRLYGGNTSTGKTALSVGVWARTTTVGAGTRYIISENDGGSSDRGWQSYIDADSFRAQIHEDGAGTTKKQYYHSYSPQTLSVTEINK